MYRISKRILDYIFAAVLAIILLPLFALVALAIKLDSHGPILFLQRRVGVNRRHFYIYKFRSMQIGTPNVATDRLSQAQSYVTRVGRIIRKTSLDELPQLINILKGDMSFIGPRPALYNQFDLIQSREELGINSIRPGLTGYAQVMGRDNISDFEKVQYDKYYKDRVSLVFDIEIVARTIVNVVWARDIKQ